jgi:hypothetical protein
MTVGIQKNWSHAAPAEIFGCTRCSILSSRHNLLPENMALRRQLAVLKPEHSQTRFAAPEKLFWVMLRRGWC